MINRFVLIRRSGDVECEVATEEFRSENKGPWPVCFRRVESANEGAKKMKENPRDPRLPVIEGQTVGSFKGGLQTLPEGLAKQLGEEVVKLQWKLVKLEKSEDDLFSLTYETPEGEKKLRAKSVVFTQPAYVVADTVRDIAPESAKSFEKFYYPPVASVTVAYKRDVRQKVVQFYPRVA